jgi:hypothetical protein
MRWLNVHVLRSGDFKVYSCDLKAGELPKPPPSYSTGDIILLGFFPLLLGHICALNVEKCAQIYNNEEQYLGRLTGISCKVY